MPVDGSDFGTRTLCERLTSLTVIGFLLTPPRFHLFLRPDDFIPLQYIIERNPYSDKVETFQDVKDSQSKQVYRFLRTTGSRKTIEVLEINAEIPRERFRPEMKPGVELLDNAGTAQQSAQVISAEAAKP